MTENIDTIREKSKITNAQDAALQYLTFTVQGEEYGVDIMAVREIKGWTETTRLPNSPACMRGVINLRGIIIPIFDLHTRFHKQITQPTSSHVVVILAVGDRNIGILVDAVSDILTVNADDVKPVPEIENKIDTDFISGLISLQQRLVVLLAVDELFSAELLQTMKTSNVA